MGDQELEVTNPTLGTMKIRGTDVINVVAMICLVLLAVTLYYHMKETAAQSATFVSAIQEMTAVQKAANTNQKLMTCILSTADKDRRDQYSQPNSFCQQMSKL